MPHMDLHRAPRQDMGLVGESKSAIRLTSGSFAGFL